MDKLQLLEAIERYISNEMSPAEKAAFEVINKSGSYDFWITKSYNLLGDVYFKQKDYFNAKATYHPLEVVKPLVLVSIKALSTSLNPTSTALVLLPP